VCSLLDGRIICCHSTNIFACFNSPASCRLIVSSIVYHRDYVEYLCLCIYAEHRVSRVDVAWDADVARGSVETWGWGPARLPGQRVCSSYILLCLLKSCQMAARFVTISPASFFYLLLLALRVLIAFICSQMHGLEIKPKNEIMMYVCNALDMLKSRTVQISKSYQC